MYKIVAKIGKSYPTIFVRPRGSNKIGKYKIATKMKK